MNYTDIVQVLALQRGLEPALVLAQIQVESEGNPYAWNPEPRYRYLWNVRTNAPFRALTTGEINSKTPPPDFPCVHGDADQEWWAQQASWGLMQLMGAVAREDGFKGPYLTELTEPNLSLQFGIKHLAKLVAWAKGDVEQALAAYNGGRGGNDKRPFRNQAYAAKVLAAKKVL